MPYVTSIERLAREEGALSMLLTMLARKIGKLSKPLEGRVRRLSQAQRDQLAEALFSLNSLADLRGWLDELGAVQS